MNFFQELGVWIKAHKVISIVIVLVVISIGGLSIKLFLNDDLVEDNDSYSDNYSFYKRIMVNGNGMQPTLKDGEIKKLKKTKNIERFNIIAIDIGKETIIKRVIALPGESIFCENGIVYVNGQRQDEEYIQGMTTDFEKIMLGDDEYFVMGDNRANSLDSRSLGPIKLKNIKGEVI